MTGERFPVEFRPYLRVLALDSLLWLIELFIRQEGNKIEEKELLNEEKFFSWVGEHFPRNKYQDVSKVPAYEYFAIAYLSHPERLLRELGRLQGQGFLERCRMEDASYFRITEVLLSKILAR
ncbi:MAG TPA: hypothetical protein VFT64_07105 [Rickettsiales bacterium]|nr:hypothetical protein [Rickettsiales bacterium]